MQSLLFLFSERVFADPSISPQDDLRLPRFELKLAQEAGQPSLSKSHSGFKINVAVNGFVAFVGHAPKVGDALRVGTSATEFGKHVKAVSCAHVKLEKDADQDGLSEIEFRQTRSRYWLLAVFPRWRSPRVVLPDTFAGSSFQLDTTLPEHFPHSTDFFSDIRTSDALSDWLPCDSNPILHIRILQTETKEDHLSHRYCGLDDCNCWPHHRDNVAIHTSNDLLDRASMADKLLNFRGRLDASLAFLDRSRSWSGTHSQVGGRVE